MSVLETGMLASARRRLVAHALPTSIAVVSVIFTLAEPAFLTPENLLGIVRQIALVGIMAAASTFVIMTGGVDLSVGPVLALAGLASFFALDAGHPTAVAVLAGLGVGLLVGLLNGTAIGLLHLPPIIVTLASLSIVRGSALILGGPDLHQIRNQPIYSAIGTGSIAGVPLPVWIFLCVVLCLVFIQRRTPLGLLVAAIGDNERAARLSGHRPWLTKMIVYGLSGLGAALAGIILSSQVHTASATYGPFGTELDVIAAIVLGGTSIMGGNGSVARSVIGVLFLGVVSNGMNILNVPVDVQLIAKGAIIAIALGLNAQTSAR